MLSSAGQDDEVVLGTAEPLWYEGLRRGCLAAPLPQCTIPAQSNIHIHESAHGRNLTLHDCLGPTQHLRIRLERCGELSTSLYVTFDTSDSLNTSQALYAITHCLPTGAVQSGQSRVRPPSEVALC